MSDYEKDELGDYTKPLRERRLKNCKTADVSWMSVESFRKAKIAELAEKLFVSDFGKEDFAISSEHMNSQKSDYFFEYAEKFIEAKDKFLSEGEK